MKTLTFREAFDFPFNKPLRLFYALWALVPIFGWFALAGFGARLVQGFLKGKYDHLPELEFWDDFKLGFMVFVKSLPFMIVYVVAAGILSEISPWLDIITTLFEVLILPIMTVHFLNKQTVGSYFEFRVLDAVFNNFKDYAITYLKALGLGIVFLLLVVVLVGIPALMFTSYIFVANFYARRAVEAKPTQVVKKTATKKKTVAKKTTKKKSATKKTTKKTASRK